jgi:hypothetical protein
LNSVRDNVVDMHCRSVLLLGVTLAGGACSGGGPVSNLAQAPAFEPKEQTKCGVTKSQAKPLIVEWSSGDRAELEARVKQGLVAVRYEGCEMEVLRCNVPGSYVYTSITRKDDEIGIKDSDDLYANIPVHAANFEAKLQKSGELHVTMTMVGHYAADRTGVRNVDLQGDCARATHIIAGFTAGAFEFFAGAGADAGGGATLPGAGAGARSTSRRETLNRDGEKAECEKSTPNDKAPPAQCGALLRVEVVPIADARQPVQPGESASLDVSGDWILDSSVPLRFVQIGSKVLGAYGAGWAYEASLRDRHLQGAFMGGAERGTIAFDFDGNGNAFTGFWGVGAEAPKNAQEGKRKGRLFAAPEPPAVDISGTWDSFGDGDKLPGVVEFVQRGDRAELTWHVDEAHGRGYLRISGRQMKGVWLNDTLGSAGAAEYTIGGDGNTMEYYWSFMHDPGPNHGHARFTRHK